MNRQEGNIEFNLTSEQKERFNAIYKETERLYPNLVGDDVSIQRTKTLIAYTLISDDKPLIIKEEEEEKYVFTEIKQE
jgi:hypothetical protein